MKRLYFKYTKFGKIERLVVQGFLLHEATQIPGAVQGRDKSIFTYPPDEILARRIIRLFPNTVVDKSITMWLEEAVKHVKFITGFKALEKYDDLEVPNSAKLYPFQTVDVGFMELTPKCINANQMGTGKTVECLVYAEHIDAKKVLIVCSQSKMQDWADEIQTWITSDNSTTKIIGKPLQKQKALYVTSRFKIITYGMLRDASRYGTIFIELWDLVLVDEAHKLKNMRAAQTAGCVRLKCARMVLLTGTPMLNRPSELYALLHILYPERFSSYWTFVDRFCTTEEGWGGNKQPTVTGVKNTEVLQYILAPIMIRRLKKDVMAYLPDKIYKTIYVELTGKDKKEYEQMEKESMIDRDGEDSLMASNKLTQMIRLRQLAIDPGLLGEGQDLDGPKTEVVLDLLEEAIENEEKTVVFSTSRIYIERLSKVLDKAKINYAMMHGKLNEAQKTAAKHKFKNDPDCAVFICTLGTGGEGINLQNASMMVFVDKSWVPGEMEQAEDRVHRDGQTKNPLIVSLVCKNTIDTDIEDVLRDKSNVITQVMVMNAIVKKILSRS